MVHTTTVNPYIIFFFNDTATTEIYTLSLHDALPIWNTPRRSGVSAAICWRPTSEGRSGRIWRSAPWTTPSAALRGRCGQRRLWVGDRFDRRRGPAVASGPPRRPWTGRTPGSVWDPARSHRTADQSRLRPSAISELMSARRRFLIAVRMLRLLLSCVPAGTRGSSRADAVLGAQGDSGVPCLRPPRLLALDGSEPDRFVVAVNAFAT